MRSSLLKRSLVLTPAVAFFAASVQSAMGQQYALQHTISLSLGSQFFFPDSTTSAPGSAYGSIPLSVAFDGTNAYIGGYNETAAASTVGIVEVQNFFTASPTFNPLSPSLFTSQPSRGVDAMAYESTTNKLYLASDQGNGNNSLVEQMNLDGTLGWQDVNPYSSRPAALAIDPHGDKDTNGPAVGLLIQNSGRRISLKLADGSTSYSPSGSPAPNGGIINTTPTTGTSWRDLTFDANGDMAMSNARGVSYAVDSGVNTFQTLSGTNGASSAVNYKALDGSQDFNNVGLGVAIMQGDSASNNLLAFSMRNLVATNTAVSTTDSTGASQNFSATAVQIRNLDGTTAGLTQTALNGNEDGLGSTYTGVQKNIFYTTDSNGLPELLVLDLNGRLDGYTLEPTWTATGGGVWGTSGNWLLNDVPNNNLMNAKFGSAINTPSTVTLDGPKTVKVLKFDNLNKYTITGSTITLDSAGTPEINVLSGSHEIDSAIFFNKSTSVDIAGGSTLTIANSYSTAGSSVGLTKTDNGTLVMKNLQFGSGTISGGTLMIASNGTSAALSNVSTLTLAGSTPGEWTSTLDLNNNAAIVDYGSGNPSTVSTIADQVKQGYNGGDWTGNGITSSTAAAIAANGSNHHKTAIGYLDTASYTPTSFFGTTPDSNSVLMRYTYVGDANLDGTVNALDFNALATSFGNFGMWQNGDFDNSGIIDSTDFADMAANYNLSMPSSSMALGATSLGSIVPEPGALMLLAAPAIFLRRRMRRA